MHFVLLAHWRPRMNWSSPISNNSFLTPSPPRCSTGARGFLITIQRTQYYQHLSSHLASSLSQDVAEPKGGAG